MSFTLGLDLGIVMAKGVVFGVIGCVTILPALILACDKAIEKTKHKILMPDVSRIATRDSIRSMLWVPHISSSHRAICQRQTA